MSERSITGHEFQAGNSQLEKSAARRKPQHGSWAAENNHATSTTKRRLEAAAKAKL